MNKNNKNTNFKDKTPITKGFRAVRTDGQDRGGGGIVTYIKETSPSQIPNTLNNKSYNFKKYKSTSQTSNFYIFQTSTYPFEMKQILITET